jgi:hypothetical protein
VESLLTFVEHGLNGFNFMLGEHQDDRLAWLASEAVLVLRA